MNKLWILTAGRDVARRAGVLTLMAIGLAWLAACASTGPQLKGTWKDPAFTGPPLKQLLVIGAFKSDANRRVIEDAFTGALKAAGTGAESSYGMLPESGQLANERVRAAANRSGADGVLVVRVLRMQRNVVPATMDPVGAGGLLSWYGGAYQTSPADVTVSEVLTIESTLWSVRTDKPVWSGTSEINAPSSVAEASKQLAAVLIAKMKADGVI